MNMKSLVHRLSLGNVSETTHFNVLLSVNLRLLKRERIFLFKSLKLPDVFSGFDLKLGHVLMISNELL